MTSDHETTNLSQTRSENPSEDQIDKGGDMTESKTISLRNQKKRPRISSRQALLPLARSEKIHRPHPSKAIFQLKTELHRLQTRDREWKSMFQMISHDLKEPILTLEGFSKLLTETNLNDDQKRYVTIIRDAVNILHQLVGSLQSIARLSQDPQEYSDFSLKEVLESVVVNLASHISRTNGRVILPEEDILMRGDPIRLFQIVINITANALRYHKKGAAPVIRISQKKTPQEIKISISDNGIGMTSRELQKLFVPFTRLSDVNNEGMGLGLSIVKRIAESLKGRVAIKSKPDIGTTVTISLPRHDSKSPEVEPRS